ncbi:glycosyltransferase [Xanthomonas vesicatoria]|nr:glycosyltransferase [Xanthomonas vesicatoria]
MTHALPVAHPAHLSGFRIAVLVPCHNEAATVADVVGDFAAALPGAAIHVLDNNSSDATASNAAAAGAQVCRVALQGKGNVVRRGFADVEADIYVLVDGDATYDAAAAPALVRKLIDERLDMVVGARRDQQQAAYRPGHRLGNVLLTRCAGGAVRAQFRRHAVRLPGVFAALRQIVCGTCAWLRDRNRACRACLAAAHAGGRSRDSIWRAPGRVAEQVKYLARRLAHPHHDCKTVQGRAAVVVFLDRVCAQCRVVDRAGDPIVRDLSANRFGAALSDRDPVCGADAAWLSVAGLRADSGYGHAWACGSQTSGLSRRAGRRPPCGSLA